MANLQVIGAPSAILNALAARAADGDRKRSHPSDPDNDDLPAAKRPCAASGARLPSISNRQPASKHEIPPRVLDFLRHATELAPETRLAMLETLICLPYFGTEVPREPFVHNVVQIGIVVDNMAGIDPVPALMRLYLFLAGRVFCTKEQLAIAKRTWLAGSASAPEIPAAVRGLLNQAIKAPLDRRPHILVQLDRLIPHLSNEERLFAVSLFDLNCHMSSGQERSLLRHLCKMFVSEAMADMLPTVQIGACIVVVPERMSPATAMFLTAQLAGKLVHPTREYADLSGDEELAAETIAAAVFLLDRA